MMVLDVLKMGNPLLREKCKEVDIDTISSDNSQSFIEDLIDTMRAENGAGIAAPQVGRLQRIFVMECDNNPRYPRKSSFPLTVMINPTINQLGDALVDSWEGCLSIPGLRGMLPRAAKVELAGYDRYGQPFTKVIEDFEAVVAQHELDHLNGVLFLDRMDDMSYLTFQEEYVKYWLNV